MTDLRDQLADFETAARRLLTPARPLLVLVRPNPATCHPGREHFARGLCRGCYEYHRYHGTLDDHPRVKRSTSHFAADYALLRAEGYTRTQIAERLAMRRNTVDAAYRRAVRAGALTPDRRPA